jgi:hypothetical protein
VPPQKKRVEFSRSRKCKLEVLLFLECHRVLKAKGDKPLPPVRQSPAARKAYEKRLEWWRKEEYVRPSHSQASLWFLIPQTTVSTWWRTRDRIFNSPEGSRVIRNSWTCWWPEMERELFRLFSKHREMGYITRRWWFRSTSIRLFREIYADPLRAQGKNNSTDFCFDGA